MRCCKNMKEYGKIFQSVLVRCAQCMRKITPLIISFIKQNVQNNKNSIHFKELEVRMNVMVKHWNEHVRLLCWIGTEHSGTCFAKYVVTKELQPQFLLRPYTYMYTGFQRVDSTIQYTVERGGDDNRSDCLYHRLPHSKLILLASPLSLWAVTNDALN